MSFSLLKFNDNLLFPVVMSCVQIAAGVFHNTSFLSQWIYENAEAHSCGLEMAMDFYITSSSFPTVQPFFA